MHFKEQRAVYITHRQIRSEQSAKNNQLEQMQALNSPRKKGEIKIVIPQAAHHRKPENSREASSARTTYREHKRSVQHQFAKRSKKSS